MCVIKSDRCIINRQGAREYILQGHRCRLIHGEAVPGKNAAYQVETANSVPYLLLVLGKEHKYGCTCSDKGRLGYCQHCTTVRNYLRSVK